MSTSAINHLVIVPVNSNERRTTFFQGYSDFWYPDYLKILKCLIFFPHDVSDAYLSGESFINARTVGACLQVEFLRADLLERYLSFEHNKLTVLWSTSETADIVEDTISKSPYKLLHITTSNKQGIISLTELDEDLVNQLISDIFTRASTTDAELNDYRKFLESKGHRTRKDVSLKINTQIHNCTEPLIDLLVNYGAQITASGIKPSGSSTEHISEMLRLAAIIDDLRPSDFAKSPFRKNDAIVHCPSVYTYLYRADDKQWRDLNRHLNNPKRNFLKATLIRGKGYGNSSIEISEEDVFNPYEDKILGPLLWDRQIELKIFTTTISIVASNQFIPAIRLPNSVMLHHDKLKDIGLTVNSNIRQWHASLSRKFFEYSELIKSDIGEALLSGIFNKREKLLAVCDFPIEWVSIDLLPVMFRYELSRIPSTPGNVTSNVLLSIPKHSYPYSALCDILIIRSFDEHDKIKDHLSEVVRWGHDEGRLKGLNVQLIDVDSKEEMIDALKSFRGVMVIFDCHGGHGGEKNTAWLHIGNENVDVWHIYQSTRVPPIVVLAACSTHPVEGSHASVANGFLESGACSVLGTFAPINSDHAATFVIRLLTRVAIYLPVALKARPYTWREIISGLFKMSYTRDVLTYLRDEKRLLTQEQYAEIHIKTNILINATEDKEWFEKFKTLISEQLNIDEPSTKDLFITYFQFVQTMLMVQLGRPENIVIIAD